MKITIDIPDELVDEIDDEITMNSHNECELGSLPSTGAWALFQSAWQTALETIRETNQA